MGMFVDQDDRVPITVEGEVDPAVLTPQTDAIWIYPVMPVGVEQKVISRAVHMTAAKNGARPQRGKGQKSRRAEVDTTYDAGIYSLALLEANVLAWQGPAFTDPKSGQVRPCTPENIRKLNTKDPLVQKVLEEIGERNAPADEPEDDETTPAPDGEGNELPNA